MDKRIFREKVFDFLNHRNMLRWMPDKEFLELAYRLKMRRKLDLDTPKTYTEKLQWLKLYDRKPEYTMMVDKYEVKKYVSNIIGKEYVIPTFDVWNKFEEIRFDELPEQFVLKCTHDSGGLVICKDKTKLDMGEAYKKISSSLKRNYYLTWREWPYKDVIPRIIAEPYLVDESGVELKDYKFFCFNGKVKCLFIGSNRGVDTRFDFYDENFNHLPILNGHANADNIFTKPIGFAKMKHLAEELSKDLVQGRIDFYNINGKVYFGEITFFHWSGLVRFEPEEWDYKFGSWFEIPDTKKHSNR